MEGRKRAPYTKKDETRMWRFLYDKLQVAGTAEPKGLLMWEDYVTERKCARSAHSLNTHFRRHMVNNLHNADLDCREMMFLYRRLRLKMDPDVKRALELKFSVNIILDENAYVKTFKINVRTVNQREEADGNTAQNTDSSTGRGRGALHIPSDEGSSGSPLRKRSSLNFTEEIEILHVNSRYQVRYGRPPFQVNDADFNSSDDELPLTQPSSSTANESSAKESTDQNQQSYAEETNSRASQDQFSPLEEQVLESCNHVQVTTVRECASNATQAAVAVTDAADLNQNNPPLDQIYVSETSESCEVAYQRLYKAIANPSSQLVESNGSEQLQRITSEWQTRMEQMLNKYGISGAHAENCLNAVLGAQKNLLLRLNQAEYSESLCALEKCMEEILQALKHQLKPIAERPLSCVTTRSGIPAKSINLMHTDSSKVPLTVRARKTLELLSSFTPHDQLLTNEQLIDRIIRFEDLAASTPEMYDYYMLKAREAAEERVHRAKGRSLLTK